MTTSAGKKKADAPVLDASDAVAVSSSVNEDGTVALTITPHFDSHPDATDTITISFLTTRPPPSSTLFPYTTLFRSYTLSVADLAGLTLHAPDSDLASISMSV